MSRVGFVLLVSFAAWAEVKVGLPNKEGSVKFAVIGDNGTGDKPQYEVAEQMEKAHEQFPFGFVLMMGDNIYGKDTPADMKKKFEDPYRPLLDAGVKFYASLGNHDSDDERYYKLYNMDGNRYYTLKKANVEFIALDSNYMDTTQVEWLKQDLQKSDAAWKICFFHHPLYSAAHFHGPAMPLRRELEPIFEKAGVEVVLSGHEHVYERINPQHGIFYWVLGNSGQLRPHDLRSSPETAKGFDTDQAFMLMEISGDDLFFQTVSRTGETVDTGTIHRK